MAHFIKTDSGMASLSLTLLTSKLINLPLCFCCLICWMFLQAIEKSVFSLVSLTEGPEIYHALKQHPAKKIEVNECQLVEHEVFWVDGDVRWLELLVGRVSMRALLTFQFHRCISPFIQTDRWRSSFYVLWVLVVRLVFVFVFFLFVFG